MIVLTKTPFVWEAYVLKARDRGGPISHLPGLEAKNLLAKRSRAVFRALIKAWRVGVRFASCVCVFLKRACGLGFAALSGACFLLAWLFDLLAALFDYLSSIIL